MNLDGHIAIVTGASRGIGRAIAEALAKNGANVACISTSVDGAQKTVDAIKQSGGKASAYACDVSKSDEVESVVDLIAEKMGPPKILVNNAGVTRDNLILRMKEEDWDRVIEVNLKGAFLLIREVSKHMVKQRYGRIVNMSSVIGLHGGAGQANYAASKAGIVGLTLSVAKELGSRNITCNAIAPGFIQTDMTANLPLEFQDFVQKNAPIGRLGTPSDVVPAVLFFALPESGYVTGQVLTVDGGLML